VYGYKFLHACCACFLSQGLSIADRGHKSIKAEFIYLLLAYQKGTRGKPVQGTVQNTITYTKTQLYTSSTKITVITQYKHNTQQSTSAIQKFVGCMAKGITIFNSQVASFKQQLDDFWKKSRCGHFQRPAA